MPARSVLITLTLVLAGLLAVALSTRFAQTSGVQRSVLLGTGLMVQTSLPGPVAVMLDTVQPDGSTTCIGWCFLGTIPGSHSAALITPPTSGVLQVRWARGKSITQGTTDLIGLPATLGGGPGGQTPPIEFRAFPGSTTSSESSQTFILSGAPGLITILEDHAEVAGGTLAPTPPPPPKPLPPPAGTPAANP